MSPTEHYSERLEERERSRARLDRLHGRIGIGRLLFAAIFLIVAWGSIARNAASPLWSLVPGFAFVALVLYHQRVQTLRALAGRAVAFYRSGLERLQGQRRGGGPSGEQFMDEHHLYGADLDLFGKQSLFERLCAARTQMGQATLANWLLAPADLEIIRERQTCVAELRAHTDLREDLAVLGEAPQITLHPDMVTQWAAAPPELSNRWLPITAFLLAASAVATAVIWALWGFEFPFLVVLVIEAGMNYALRNRVQAAVSGVEHAYEDLKLLSTLLRRVESESFDAPALRALKAKLSSHSLTASITLSKLATIVNFVEARRNPLLAPLMLPLMYTIQSALAAERWRRLHRHAVASWLSVLGDIEALESIAAFSFERPDDPFPEFLQGPAVFVATGLGHPLISPQTRVRNDVDISGDTRVLLVSGSNMSGKSTLLRAVGMNTVLAMAGAPVCAARLRLTPLQVGASIRVNDSLYEGSSRFYAEITRLRQLFEPSPAHTSPAHTSPAHTSPAHTSPAHTSPAHTSPVHTSPAHTSPAHTSPAHTSQLPLLFLLDELLQGTNSTDRRIGAQGVVRALLDRGAIGLISTHDLALTEGTELRRGALKNVHFQDELEGGKLTFDFKLRDGVVTKSNGIELMRAIGLDV